VPVQVYVPKAVTVVEEPKKGNVAAMAVGAATLVTSIILTGALNQMWSLINGLQMLVNIPLFKNITVPDFAGVFLGQILAVA